MVDNDFRIGMLLVDAPAAARKAFRADVRVVRLEDTSNLTAATCIASEDVHDTNTTREKTKARVVMHR